VIWSHHGDYSCDLATPRRLLNTTTKTHNILFHHGRETPFVVLIFLLSRPSIDVGQQRFLLSLQCIAIIKGIMWRARHTIQG